MLSQSTQRKKSWHSQTRLVRDRCCALVNYFLNRAIVTTCPGLPYTLADAKISKVFKLTSLFQIFWTSIVIALNSLSMSKTHVSEFPYVAADYIRDVMQIYESVWWEVGERGRKITGNCGHGAVCFGLSVNVLNYRRSIKNFITDWYGKRSECNAMQWTNRGVGA